MLDVDDGGVEGCACDHVRMLAREQPDLAPCPHAEHAKFVEDHNLGSRDVSSVDHHADLALEVAAVLGNKD